MKKVNKEFNRVCKAKYADLGFVKIGANSYGRMNSGLLQTFELESSRHTPRYRVIFGVRPLCTSAPVRSLGGGIYDLVRFDVDRYAETDGWLIESDVDDVAKSVESMAEAIDRYLIPFFQRCYDCKTTLEELIKLDEIFADNQKEMQWRKGIIARTSPNDKRSLFQMYSYDKFCLAIKSSNYAFVRGYLLFHIQYQEEQLSKIDIPKCKELGLNSHWEYLLEKIEELKKQYNLLEAGEYGYFEKIVENNEKKMMDFIKEKYPKLLKTQKRNGWE